MYKNNRGADVPKNATVGVRAQDLADLPYSAYTKYITTYPRSIDDRLIIMPIAEALELNMVSCVMEGRSPLNSIIYPNQQTK